jgi:hypothetical protein
MSVTRWLRVQWDRALAVALAVGGVIALVLGWQGVANAVVPAGQIPYVLSGGVGGLFALGLGATLWVAAELRDQWFKLDRLEEELRAGRLAQEVRGAEVGSDVESAVSGPGDSPVATNGQGNGATGRGRATRTGSGAGDRQ